MLYTRVFAKESDCKFAHCRSSFPLAGPLSEGAITELVLAGLSEHQTARQVVSFFCGVAFIRIRRHI